MSYLLKVEAPPLIRNVSYEGKSIILQAVGENGVYSNSESIDIISHESVETPGFSTIAVVAATGLGALVAFFRRRH